MPVKTNRLRQALCSIEALPEGQSRGFTVHARDGVQDILLVHKNKTVVAYRNSCPHTGGPLDWVPDQFLDLDGNFIQCATHDALFRIDNGFCVAGPCSGERLSAVDIEVADGVVWFVSTDE